MAIKLRRGNKVDLVVGNLQQGEPVVALDTKEFGVKGQGADMIWGVTTDRTIAGVNLQSDISKEAMLEALSLTQPELTESLGMSHRNLLHNWDFRNPVNQRGITTLSPGVSQIYFVDRWYSSRTNITVNAESLSVAWDGVNGTDGWIQQKIEGSKALIGKTVTISVEIGGEFRSETLTVPTIENTTNAGGFVDNVKIGVSNYSNSYIAVVVFFNTTTTKTLTRTKLELGSVSTFANDPPADYGEQLSICQRYQYAIKSYARYAPCWIATNWIDFAIPTPCNMRINPVLAINNLTINDGGTEVTGFTISVISASTELNIIMIRATKNVHGVVNPNLSIKSNTISLFDSNM